MMGKAIVLLSGGLDSATTLYLARKQGYKCFCITFDYGQRHKKEIESAKKVARAADCPLKVIKINLPWKGSSLLDRHIGVPEHSNILTFRHSNRIPSTYVPARNIIFLSFALSFSEAIGARAIFIGAHTQDYSGYPDCRPEFYRAFKEVILRGTKTGVEGKGIVVKTPLINKTKARIILLAKKLKVPLQLTWSCYRGGKALCGKCDSCYYRHKGFQKAGISDPLVIK